MRIRLLANMAMLGAFVLLLADRETGNAVHECVGVVLFLAFALHTVCNRHWYTTLIRGRWSRGRVLRLCVTFLLLLALAGTLVSGALISQTVFAFAGFKSDFVIRTYHLGLAHYFLLFAGIHLGLYWPRLKAELGISVSGGKRRLRTFGPCLAAYGVYALYSRDFVYALLMQSAYTAWLDGDGIFLLLFDYAAVFWLFVLVGRGLDRLMRPASQQPALAGTESGVSPSATSPNGPAARQFLFPIFCLQTGKKEFRS